jgi:hypothetical protein
MGLSLAISISNRLMVATYYLVFVVAGWGPRSHPPALAHTISDVDL